jgi:hypothetical protein
VKIEMDLIMAWYLGAERKKSKKETEEILRLSAQKSVMGSVKNQLRVSTISSLRWVGLHAIRSNRGSASRIDFIHRVLDNTELVLDC